MIPASTGSGARLPATGGALLIDKPSGPTSHDVVVQIRRALAERRVGHTGTLDPLASGLLVILAGPATRLSHFLIGHDKRYLATIRLGIATDSLDADGRIVAEDDRWSRLERSSIVEAAERLVGEGEQVPPAFSAKKVDGEAAHRRIRRGEDVELPPVPVTIHALDVRRVALPEIDIACHVSSGTFVRSLVRDLADALGTHGHVTSLRRTAVGTMRVDDAIDLEALTGGETPIPWISPLDVVDHLPRVRVDTESARRLSHGQRLDADARVAEGLVRVEWDHRLLAIGEYRGGVLHPRKVFEAPPAESAS
ncbi:MAG: tRNA pseudouridine(55) synthase TruB [Longimicrobiales bacterium]|nr:tRNA pseudouridine(55) synthase TruB [Longimicrobiales bacterium]